MKEEVKELFTCKVAASMHVKPCPSGIRTSASNSKKCFKISILPFYTSNHRRSLKAKND
eukprot:UN06238